jgi:hypothetical protein
MSATKDANGLTPHEEKKKRKGRTTPEQKRQPNDEMRTGSKELLRSSQNRSSFLGGIIQAGGSSPTNYGKPGS